MTDAVRIRVTIGKDGKVVEREPMVDGVKVRDLSYVETLEMAMQAVSSLRFKLTG